MTTRRRALKSITLVARDEPGHEVHTVDGCLPMSAGIRHTVELINEDKKESHVRHTVQWTMSAESWSNG